MSTKKRTFFAASLTKPNLPWSFEEQYLLGCGGGNQGPGGGPHNLQEDRAQSRKAPHGRNTGQMPFASGCFPIFNVSID